MLLAPKLGSSKLYAVFLEAETEPSLTKTRSCVQCCKLFYALRNESSVRPDEPWLWMINSLTKIESVNCTFGSK